MLTIFCQNRCSQGLQTTIDCSKRMPYLNQSDGPMEINFTVCSVEEIPVMHHVEKRAIRSEILNLSSTALQHIPDGWFKHFTNLSKLDLQNNSLTELTDKTFKGLTNMKQLDISSNHFVRLKQGWFEMLNSLEKFIMNNCGIKYFEPVGFAWPDRIFHLSLKDNLIPLMPPLPLTCRNDSRWAVHLEGNDINCRCRRKEHTDDVLPHDTFSRIRSICLSQRYGETLPWPDLTSKTSNTSERIKSIWKKYVDSSVCGTSSVSFKTDCDIAGMCTAECNVSHILQREVKIYQLRNISELVPKEIKGASPIYLVEGSIFKCNRNAINQTTHGGYAISTVSPRKNKTSFKAPFVNGDNFNLSHPNEEKTVANTLILSFIIICLIISITSNVILVCIIIPLKKRCQQKELPKESECGYMMLQQR